MLLLTAASTGHNTHLAAPYMDVHYNRENPSGDPAFGRRNMDQNALVGGLPNKVHTHITVAFCLRRCTLEAFRAKTVTGDRYRDHGTESQNQCQWMVTVNKIYPRWMQ